MAVDYCPHRRGLNLPRAREMMLYPRQAMRRQYNGASWTRLDTPCIRKGCKWMHGECIYPTIINFNAYHRCHSSPLPEQQLSGPSYEIYFVFMYLAIVGKQLFFEIRSLLGEQCLLIPYRGKWLLAGGLMPDFENIPIAHEVIIVAIVHATLPTTAPSSQLKGCVGMNTESVTIDLYWPPR